MGKGEIAYYDMTFNFTTQMNKYLSENSNLSEKDYVDDLYEKLQIYIPLIAKKASYQYEKGLKTGNHHIQMRLKLITPLTHSLKIDKGIVCLINKGMIKGANISPTCSTVVENDDWNYTKKIDSKCGNHFMFSSNTWTITDLEGNITIEKKPLYIPRQYRNLTMKKWQQFIIDQLNDFCCRKINFVYDPEGNQGKSTIAALGDLLHDCIDLPPINDFNQLIATTCDICIGKQLRSPKAVFVDLPRAMDKSKLGGFITACEQIKKGKLYDFRHHYKEWWIDSPQIWIFSNIMIDFDLLSADRWNTWVFIDGELVKKNIKDEQNINVNTHSLVDLHNYYENIFNFDNIYHPETNLDKNSFIDELKNPLDII